MLSTRCRNEYGYPVVLHRTDAPRRDLETRWERMRCVERLLRGGQYRRAEIARLLGVNRSTVGRWIDEMSRTLPIREDEEGKVFIE